MSELCPCGCGEPMPELFDAGTALEEWMQSQGFSIADLKRDDRHKQVVETRRNVARYLHAHGWSHDRIGDFLDRDRTTVINLLKPKGQPWVVRTEEAS